MATNPFLMRTENVQSQEPLLQRNFCVIEYSARPYIKILPCVFTLVFIPGTFIDFGTCIEWRNSIAIPLQFFQMVNTALLSWEGFNQVKNAFKFWYHNLRFWCKYIPIFCKNNKLG